MSVKKPSQALSAHMSSSRSTRRVFSTNATVNRPPVLPRLPVPDLHQTLTKYLRSLIPLLKEDEVRGGLPWQSALRQRQQWADEFERGLGAQCQERLHGKSAKWSLTLGP
jgi:Choline/Carnitine o-acyltransferase